MAKQLPKKLIAGLVLVCALCYAAYSKFSGSSSSSTTSVVESSKVQEQAVDEKWDITSEETFGVTDYLTIPTDLMVPTVYLENNIRQVDSYNIASTVYKNYLVNVAALNDTPKAIDLMNEFYLSLYNIKDVPKNEIVIFYIDTMRHLYTRLSRGLNETSYTTGIRANDRVSSLSEAEKIQFLANLKHNLNQVTDNFFSENQFIGRQYTGLTQEQNTEEYQRYQIINREVKNMNEALIQFDHTCINNFTTAGNVINCLQQKLSIAFAAIDMQLLSTLKVYLVTHEKEIGSELVNNNMKQLQENFSSILELNQRRFEEDAKKLK